MALLHWDSVWRKREIINQTEREGGKVREREPTENRKSIERENGVQGSERKKRRKRLRKMSKP